MGRINRFIWFLVMIVIGGAAGLYYAWYVKPAEFVNAALYNLRPDYKTDYVLMVAEIYDDEHDRFQALVRLDKILAPSDPSRETVVEAAITNAENLGYAPVDLQKLYRLREAVTGNRPTPTETIDPTLRYQNEMTMTAAVQQISAETSTPTPNNSGVPVADDNPFNTGIQITTDPNAAPMLDLPPAPTITPPGGGGSAQDDFGFDSAVNSSFDGF